MKVLLLGGTRDALSIADKLLTLSETNHIAVSLIYSIAGIVRQPTLPCPIHTGGFSQYASERPEHIQPYEEGLDRRQQGLKNYLQQHQVDMVIDATHPYAINMSDTASKVCHRLQLPLLKYCRQPWQQTAQDHWTQVNNWVEAKSAMQRFERPFIAIGRSALEDVDGIPSHQFWLIRSAIEGNAIKNRYRIINAIGPFSTEQEVNLLTSHQVDVLVCKNSGGPSVGGKIIAARQLNLPVIMINRPNTDAQYGDLFTCKNKLQTQFQHLSREL